MTIYYIFFIISVIFIITSCILRKYLLKYKVVDIVRALIYFISCAYIMWYSSHIELDIMCIIASVLFIIAELYFTGMERILKEFDKVRDKIDKCEESVRLDISNHTIEILKEYYSHQIKIIRTYDKMTNTLIKDVFDRMKRNNEEVERIINNLENDEEVEDGEDFTNTL